MLGKGWPWYLEWYYNQSSIYNLVEVKLCFEISSTISLCSRMAEYQELKTVCKFKPIPYKLAIYFKLDGLQRNYDPILLGDASALIFQLCFPGAPLLHHAPPTSLLSPAPDQTPGDWWTGWRLRTFNWVLHALREHCGLIPGPPPWGLTVRSVSLSSPKHTHSWLTPSGQSSLEVT